MRLYHDEQWGVPCHDRRELFEMLILEGAQAGLSWRTVLHKRAAYREAFDGFDATVVAGYGPAKIEELLANPGIIRNRLKVNAAVANARAALELGDFGRYLWGFVDGVPIVNSWERQEDLPASTDLSDCLGRDLKRRGFKFVGSTIVYSLMQSVGMVNDHVTWCEFRFPRVG
jgi:DNA-3-methyladenine glycosylase I